jgi:hypothetical protein
VRVAHILLTGLRALAVAVAVAQVLEALVGAVVVV